MNAAAGEFGRAGASVARRQHAILVAIQRDRWHGDRRQRRQLPLQLGILRITRRKAEAMAIAVDDDVDITGIVVRHRGTLEGDVIEIPIGGPFLP